VNIGSTPRRCSSYIFWSVPANQAGSGSRVSGDPSRRNTPLQLLVIVLIVRNNSHHYVRIIYFYINVIYICILFFCGINFYNFRKLKVNCTSKVIPVNSIANPSKTDKNSYYCDRNLLLSLVYDAKMTEWFAQQNVATSNRDETG